MLETLENLRLITKQEDYKRDYKDLALEYSKTLNPSILAVVFDRNFGQINNLGNKYPIIAKEDLASFALEILDKCLQTYNADKAEFLTYFTNNLNFRLREEVSLLNTHKRKSIFNSNSFEIMVENGFELEDSEISNFETLDILEREVEGNLLKYCKLLMEGFTNNEIGKILGVSNTTLHNYRNKLKSKLEPSLNF